MDRLRSELETHRFEMQQQGEELRTSQAALEAALREYTHLFESAPIGYFVVGRDSSIRSVNIAGARLLGIDRSRLPGLRLAAWVIQPDVGRFERLLDMAVGHSDAPVQEPTDVTARVNGNVRYLRFWASRLLRRDHEVPVALLAVEDVTELKRAEALATSIARFPRENPDPVFRVSADGVVVWANDSAHSLLGIAMVDSGSPPPPDVVESVREAVARSASIRRELLFESRWFALHFVPVGEEVNVYGQDVTERRRIEEALRTAEQRLVLDLDAMTRLHRLSSRFVREDLAAVLGEVVEAAIAITGADMGNIQLLDPATRRLRIAAQRGHEKWWMDFFESVVGGESAASGAAAAQRTRVIIEDVTTSPVFSGTPALDIQARAGIRAVQSTPLIGSSGDLVGMISTHYRTPRRPDERALPFLDLLARQAADMVERGRTEELLRHNEKRLQALADSMPLLAWTAKSDGFITWYNRRWYEYTGTTLEQMAGWGWQTVHDPAALPDVLKKWNDCLANGEPFEMEFPLRGADGDYRRFLTRAVPLKDENEAVVQWFGTSTDVTELMQAQESLREEGRRKDEFLGMLSHELRNPLTPIRNSAYLLRQVSAESGQARRAGEVIGRQAEHLTRLVDDLLDMTRIARGKIELRRSRVDLRDILHHAAEDHRLTLENRGVEFRTDLPGTELWADVDATRITQIVGNLLHNAAKFTRQGDEVTLTARAVSGEAEIRVRDSGIGIEPALLARLFEPFVQGEKALARTDGGLGLGLALVKGIAEMHGGTVRATSGGKGMGAEFVVLLPLAQPPHDRPSAQVPSEERPVGRRVLVVDDNADAAETLAELLRLKGHVVDVAYDGPGALAKLEATQVDAVFCDIGLPMMSGYDLAREVRARGSGVRLIAVTGYARPEDVQQAMAAGFDSYLAKPPDPEELVRALQ